MWTSFWEIKIKNSANKLYLGQKLQCSKITYFVYFQNHFAFLQERSKSWNIVLVKFPDEDKILSLSMKGLAEALNILETKNMNSSSGI
jgi:hypothetical protein